LKVLVTGSTGLIGSRLAALLTGGGDSVVPLVRRSPRTGEVRWDPDGSVDAAALEGADAVVHLAGESIVGRWTDAKKAKIRESRVRGTRVLAEALAGLERPPRVLACASAIGFYGDRGDERLDESSPQGAGFLPEVCRDWEAAAAPARGKGIRVANLRFGMVLSPHGGALAKMLPPFRIGAGGIIGSGRQYWSWIALDDAVGAIHHVLQTDALHGPVNAVAPQSVTNREFTKTLGKVLSRPTFLPMPAFAARLALGEMADALLLASARVEPKKLTAAGYPFALPGLEEALLMVLGKTWKRRDGPAPGQEVGAAAGETRRPPG
jgi:hypothetical protein